MNGKSHRKTAGIISPEDKAKKTSKWLLTVYVMVAYIRLTNDGGHAADDGELCSCRELGEITESRVSDTRPG